ncbi:MAG TPA: MOSC domain-containing protein [Solirubrobacteraceae bacterium]
MSEAIVTGLAVAAVKGTRLHAVEQIELAAHGARGNRAFYVIDARGRMLNGKQLGQLQAVVASFDPVAGELGLTFPDGGAVRGIVRYGDKIATRFFSLELWARPLEGPWADALSEFAGRSLRLVEAGTAVDRGRRGAVSVISRASMRRLAEEAGEDEVDVRRFRMLVEIDGVAAHEEDRWVGQRVRLGPAVVAMHGHVGRCLVTSRDPDTGEITLPTLDLLGNYRHDVDTTEPLPFGVYGEVLAPGTVSVGDAVALDGRLPSA